MSRTGVAATFGWPYLAFGLLLATLGAEDSAPAQAVPSLADEALQEKLNSIRERAAPLLEAKQRSLLAQELRELLKETVSSPEMAEAIATSRAKLTRPEAPNERPEPPENVAAKEKPCAECPEEIVIKMPSKCQRALQVLRNRLIQQLWVRSESEVAEPLTDALKRSGAGIKVLMAYDLFAKAESDEERKTILGQLDPEFRDTVELLKPPAWGDAEEAKMAQVVKQCQALSEEALTRKSDAAVSAAEEVLFIAWLRDPEGEEFKQSLKGLCETAETVHPGDEGLWRINKAASAHFDERRYGLAGTIYEQVYRRADGEMQPAHLFAGLRRVRCEWEAGNTTKSKYTERPKAWEVLREMAPKLRWHKDLEQELVYVVRNIDPSAPELVDIVKPYFVLQRENGSSVRLRQQAAQALAFMLECAGRAAEAAAAYARAAEITDNPDNRAYYAKKSVELSGIAKP
jgi:hypothetical protein